jgi:hypothetical protein
VERGRIAPQDAEKYSNTLLMQMFQDNQEDFHASFGHTGANAGAGETEGTENDAAASAAAAGGSTFYFDEQDAAARRAEAGGHGGRAGRFLHVRKLHLVCFVVPCTHVLRVLCVTSPPRLGIACYYSLYFLVLGPFCMWCGSCCL